MSEIRSLVKLFKVYENEEENLYSPEDYALSRGIWISENAPAEAHSAAIDYFGVDGEQWNKTFNVNWENIAEAPDYELIARQIMHYISVTFVDMGFLNNSEIYIPTKTLEVPELTRDFKITIIHGVSRQEIQEHIKNLIFSGIALSQETIQDLVELRDYFNFPIEDIPNKELRVIMYQQLGYIPRNVDEFLRYIIYIATGSALKVQNDYIFKELKYCREAQELLLKYPYNLKYLAEGFYRNKRLFLSMKTSKTANIINRIRKLAKKYHSSFEQPATASILSNYHSLIEKDTLRFNLDKLTVFKELQLLNGIMTHYLAKPLDYTIDKIRNGKIHIREITTTRADYDKLRNISNYIRNHLFNRLTPSLYGKTVYIPENINYKVPSTEKNFIGNFPVGTSIILPCKDDIVFGIYWENNDYRVDLDLSLMNDKQQFSWNTDWRLKNDILFSGDVTDASKGATELFRVSNNLKEFNFIINVTGYQYTGSVPFKFVVAKGSKKSFNKNYMIDPNDIIAQFDFRLTPDARTFNIGRLCKNADGLTITFNNYNFGKDRSIYYNKEIEIITDFSNRAAKCQLNLKELLIKSGAKVVNAPSVIVTKRIKDEYGFETAVRMQVPVDYNLSLENITKDTLISLLK